MATASGSSASHRVTKRLRLDLPLITCGKCEEKIVIEYRVRRSVPTRAVSSTSVRIAM